MLDSDLETVAKNFEIFEIFRISPQFRKFSKILVYFKYYEKFQKIWEISVISKILEILQIFLESFQNFFESSKLFGKVIFFHISENLIKPKVKCPKKKKCHFSTS